ncbi:MAG: response regulator [Deltaproteobacteria bacterium]|nr:response regulator [Deltaproteobacteria bacterium]
MNRHLILLADDDIEYRDTLESVLEEVDHYVVKTAGNGEEALTILKRLGSDVNLVISDIEMPGMHGIRFVETVGALGLDVPIMMATSKAGMKDDFSLKLSPQVKYFLTKPFDLDHLRRLIPPLMRTDADARRRPIVLVAEEVGETRALMEMSLESEGCCVKACGERIVALEAIRRLGRDIDMILFDFEMMGGNHQTRMEFFDLVAGTARDVPIGMMFSREEFKEFGEEAARNRAKEHLLKPIDMDTLAQVVKKHIR